MYDIMLFSFSLVSICINIALDISLTGNCMKPIYLFMCINYVYRSYSQKNMNVFRRIILVEHNTSLSGTRVNIESLGMFS